MANRHRIGAPAGGPAPELVESGFHLENADAPLLHAGLNYADLAHVFDLRRRGLIPDAPAGRLAALLLEAIDTAPADFPYNPAFGEPYNSREHYFVERIGDDAGWLHAGRPRREAVRIALRLHLRRQLADLIEATADLVDTIAVRAEEHTQTWMPDQTYLQHAQPSTFGHYLLSFAYPAHRDGQRLLEALSWTNASPGGAGCVNGTRLLDDRGPIASLLGFTTIIEHTRDAMWQTDGLVAMLADAASLVGTQAKLGEDLEIWASSEFDYVTVADAFSRSSVLMPQKRNPYSLSIMRGASGTLIGRLSGFLAVIKSPSARSDNLIYAYGEVPRALDLALRTTRLTSGVVRTLEVNAERMWSALQAGFSQATDLAEYVMRERGLDYRTAYQIIGVAVQKANAAGLSGVDIDGALIDEAAREYTGAPLGLADADVSAVLDPRRIVATRTATGGAAPQVVAQMAKECRVRAAELRAAAVDARAGFDEAEAALVAHAQALVARQGGDEEE
jgi:argininosuccinate lyase